MEKISRRRFFQHGAAGAAAALIATQGFPREAEGAPALPMAERALGRTGHKVRLFSLGGQATLEKPDTRDTSVAIINRAIDLGVNYVDTAAAYGRGISQTYIGEVMATRRKEVFLASKTHDRTRDGSLALLEQSLKLLRTDHLDLWQLHHVGSAAELAQIFGKGGAIEAVEEARAQKMIRFAGITGHADPDVLIEGINRYPFDTILMALNAADRHHLPFVEKLLPLANQKQMGVIAMKIPARGRLFRDGGVTSMKDAMSYVLSLPVSTVIVGCDDVKQLEQNVAIAREFAPMSTTDMARLEALTASYVSDASWFKNGARGWSRPGDNDQGL